MPGAFLPSSLEAWDFEATELAPSSGHKATTIIMPCVVGKQQDPTCTSVHPAPTLNSSWPISKKSPAMSKKLFHSSMNDDICGICSQDTKKEEKFTAPSSIILLDSFKGCKMARLTSNRGCWENKCPLAKS